MAIMGPQGIPEMVAGQGPEQQQPMLQAPRPRGGLMGPASAAETAQIPQGGGGGRRQQSFLDRILGLYGADPGSHIPEEERGQALRRGLREAGMATAMAGGRGHDSLTTPQALATFLGTMQGTGGRIAAEKNKALLQQLIRSGQTPAQMKQVMMSLLAAGDPESLAAAKVIQSYLSSGQGQFTLGEDQKRFDAQGNIIATNAGPTTPDGTPFDDLTKVDLGDVIQYRDPVTGELKHSYRKADSARLRSDFDKTIKDHHLVAQMLGTVEAAAANPTAAGDLAMIFAYMKILDPNSVVRESEFQNAAHTANIPERILALRQFYFDSGGRLSDKMRADFLQRSRMLARNRQMQGQITMKRYEGIANRSGVDPRDVVVDPFEPFANVLDSLDVDYMSNEEIDEPDYIYPMTPMPDPNAEEEEPLGGHELDNIDWSLPLEN